MNPYEREVDFSPATDRALCAIANSLASIAASLVLLTGSIREPIDASGAEYRSVARTRLRGALAALNAELAEDER